MTKFVLCNSLQITQQLAGLAAEVGMREYQHRIETLRTLVQHWQQGHDVAVVAMLAVDVEEDDLVANSHSPQTLLHEPSEVDDVEPDDYAPDSIHSAGQSHHCDNANTGNLVDHPDCDDDNIPPVYTPTVCPQSPQPSTSSDNPVEASLQSDMHDVSSLTVQAHPPDEGNAHLDLSVTSANSTNAVCPEQIFKQLQLPPATKKRGRPKGSQKTVIGLPKAKRGRKNLTPYVDLPHVEQQRRKRNDFYIFWDNYADKSSVGFLSFV